MDSNFVNNIIPRLRRFAQNIELEEALVDKIWEIYDDPKNVHDYQFLRDHRIIMTNNGNAKIGHWEILPNNRLLIKRGIDLPINLLFDFSLKGILLLKKVGNNQAPFLIYDKDLIPDGNIVKYLEKLEMKIIQRPPVPVPFSYGGKSNLYQNDLAQRRWLIVFLVLFFLWVILSELMK